MKIAFITGSLQPGLDGVGDYTALLAAECRAQGCETIEIALSDAHILLRQETEFRLCLPRIDSWKSRIQAAQAKVETFNPDVISFQFVIYGYHPKGIDLTLGWRFAKIAGGRAVEIMFHELWLGSYVGASLKERLIGAIQKVVIRGLLAALRPHRVHTSNPVYIYLLSQVGVKARMIPLFGSLPVSTEVPSSPSPFPDEWRFAMFGTLHPVWPPEPLLSTLLKSGRKITIIHAGRMGSGTALWEKMERDYEGRIHFVKLGQQTPSALSQFMTEADFGIATTPLALIGKSATVAAMLEHGLPTIVNRDELRFSGYTNSKHEPLLIPMRPSLIKDLETAVRGRSESRLPKVAETFLSDISA